MAPFFFESKARKIMLPRCLLLQTPLQKKEEHFKLKTFNESLYGPAKQVHNEKAAKTKPENATQ